MIKPSTASKEHLPVIESAFDCRCLDIDGNEYLDFTGSNLTVILGHERFNFLNTPNFPGKSYLEDEVSKQLSKYTKTKYFRYFKNGSDAVNCAIRLSRHILKWNDAVISFCGYAGANDAYAKTINPNGIPDQDTHQMDPELCASVTGEGILVFESRFKEIADKSHVGIKICDHLKSGINGLWENINADFHLYGKSIANGYPVAVLTGRDDYMKRIDEIYYSSTFGGDNVGLEAIKQTLKKYDRKKWLELKKYADSVLPPWKTITPKQIKQFTKNGVLFNGYWQIMLPHTKEDIDRLASLCKKIL